MIKEKKTAQRHSATCYTQSPTFGCSYLFTGVDKSKDILQVS